MTAGVTPTLATALAGRPDLLSKIDRLFAVVEDGRLDPAILDLCRKRVGTLLRCPNHAGPIPPRSEMDPRQLACVDFAELFVLDHHGITDAQAAEVIRHLGDAEMVVLTTALAVYDGFCRFEQTLTTEES
jgi:alkylhydroperoxidase family enzyme